MFLARRNDIERIAETCRAVAAGDFESRIVGFDPNSEAGRLAIAVNAMIDRMDAYVRESTASLEYVSENKYYRRFAERGMVGAFLAGAQTINAATGAMRVRGEAFHDVVESFDATAAASFNRMNETSRALADGASKMGAAAHSAATDAAAVAAAAEQAASSVHAVAAATEEMAASVQEISRQVGLSSSSAQAASDQAQATNARISELSSAVDEIGAVAQMISDIAEQTNLLALNATIEAPARPGAALRSSPVK